MAKTDKPTKAPADTPSAAPGTDDKAGKADKVQKVEYPGLANNAKLEDWPADHDSSKHKPLKRTDFKNEAVWLDKKASEMEERAAKMRKEAEMCRTLGSAADRQKAKKLQKMREQMAEIQKELAEQGVDIEALLAAAAAGGDDKAAA